MPVTPQVNDKWYRIDRILYHACDCDDACHHRARPAMTTTILYVQKITPKGVWLSSNPVNLDATLLRVEDVPRWVGLNCVKRYACPTLRAAYESFLARKVSQRRIIECNLYYTERLIEQVQKKLSEPEMRCSKEEGAECR